MFDEVAPGLEAPLTGGSPEDKWPSGAGLDEPEGPLLVLAVGSSGDEVASRPEALPLGFADGSSGTGLDGPLLVLAAGPTEDEGALRSEAPPPPGIARAPLVFMRSILASRSASSKRWC